MLIGWSLVQNVRTAAMIPSDGLEFENACQLRNRSRMALRRAGESGIHLPRYSLNMYPPSSSITWMPWRLGELLLGVAPVLRLHGSGSVDDEDHVLAVDRHPGDRLLVDRPASLLLELAGLLDHG